MYKSIVLGVVLGSGLISSVSAQDYPMKNIDLVVPFAPGGSVDVTSRLIAEAANQYLGDVKVVVSNRAGGGGIVGQNFVANANPDGYTVLAMTSSVVTNPQLKGAPYSIEDFIPVAAYNLDPEVIAVPASSPFDTIEDFVAAAEEDPLNMAVAGIGTSHHMSGLALTSSVGIEFNYMPAQGFGEQLQAVVGGHADGAFWPMGEAMVHAQAGTVRILAVASDARDANFPDVPTFEESGLGIPVWATFRGWAVPRGTSEESVTFLSELLKQVYEDEKYQQKMTDAGFDATYRDATSFQSLITSYTDQVVPIIEDNGLAR
ncbi:tripartite tricarboxylate transporter substrate binding protein [Vreelandella arcis]|uniref:Tripartite-type tricarboxylate transporter, receptor component TctC n=1 Tax=Vreelandella arcis TaxID=416873 RepID=A0A1H0BJN2_9GAMM|nr:tripartite tricarboxylate transporter substrate binding protein [Halomonas arcis]SDN45827.1 Tripartite-type tricarboxylate transporter, receptor component TctC [Halomonas arcis]